MKIYIKTDMKEMPANCKECPRLKEDEIGFYCEKTAILCLGTFERPSWCPLVEIPERSRETPHNP